MVFDSHGDIGASAGGPDGLFNCDTRYLSHLELLINDVQPLLLGSNLSDDNCVPGVDLTNPDIYRDGRLVLQKDLLHVVRDESSSGDPPPISASACEITATNRASFDLTLTFDNDFADLFEVRGEQRARRGTDCEAARAERRRARLYRPRRQDARTARAFRSAADPAGAECRRPVISISRRRKSLRCS